MMDAARVSSPFARAPNADRAPMLPIEGHIVAATRAADAARQAIDGVFVMLQHCPRDRDAMFNALAAVHAALGSAWENYAAYHEILNCEGQA